MIYGFVELTCGGSRVAIDPDEICAVHELVPGSREIESYPEKARAVVVVRHGSDTTGDAQALVVEEAYDEVLRLAGIICHAKD